MCVFGFNFNYESLLLNLDLAVTFNLIIQFGQLICIFHQCVGFI